MTQPRFIDRILNGPWDHQDIRFLPDWVHYAWAKMQPGTCAWCYHRNYLHYINCARASR